MTAMTWRRIPCRPEAFNTETHPLLVPKPGSKGGPCRDRCEHGQCRFQIDVSLRSCAVCGKPIGFDTPYWYTEAMGRTLMHAACHAKPRTTADPGREGLSA